MIRQGDVILVPVETVPDLPVIPRDRGRIVLAYGEVTGHSHAIVEADAELVGATADAVDRYLRLRSSAVLVHEEHASVMLLPGDYRVVIQEEWSDSMEPHRVVD